MTKRGDVSGSKYDRDPYNWYREPPFAVEQLVQAFDWTTDGIPNLIWDPCCGSGNILDVFADAGHPVIGSDIIDRPKRRAHRFYRQNVLSATKWPKAKPRGLSIVCNPPYGKQTGGYQQIAQNIIWRLLNIGIDFHRAAFILPIEFQAGQERYEFYQRFKPSHCAIHCQRPTMPPGAMIEALGDDAYRGGVADFVTIVWTRHGDPNRREHAWRTETIWLRPSK